MSPSPSRWISVRRVLALPYGRSVSPELRALAASQSLDTEQIRKVSAERLAALLRHAAVNVPYYREKGLELADLDQDGAAFDALAALPLLDKQTLHARFDDLKSDDLALRKWNINTSGGSTGEPTRFVQDAEYGRWRRATKILFDRWTGYEPGMPKVVLWGSERDLFRGQESGKARLVRFLRNEHFLNAFRMGPGEMRLYVETISRIRPVQVRGYANSLAEFASFVEREGLELASPCSVLSSAGTLHASMRRTITSAFGAPVFDRYGSREVGDIACELVPGGGLNVSPLTHHIEVLRNDGTAAGPGEVGEVVVTSLTNWAMPLVRYRIGDMAMWADHDDGLDLAWPRLRGVVGRTTDVFRTADGGVVMPEYLIHLVGVVLNRGDIERFQVVQEAYDHVRVLVVARAPRTLNDSQRAELRDKVRLVMGTHCRVEVELVDDIPVPPSGKFRTTISRVSPP